MSYLGSKAIDDTLTFYAVTTRFDTGAATDADSVPSYRVYEEETGTPLLTGSMALLDSANTAGFYSEQITLSAANGFEAGKDYAIYISATVNSVVGAAHKTFQIGAKVHVSTIASAAASTIWDTVMDGTNSAIKLMRGMAATLLGKASGLGTTTAVFRNVPDTKDVVTATVDADGNRSAVTTDLT